MEMNVKVTQRKAKGVCMLVIFISFVFITAGFMMSFQYSKNTNPYLETDENKPDPDLYKKSGIELVDEKIVRVVSLDDEIGQINLLPLDEQISKFEKLLKLPGLKPEKVKRYKIELDHLKLNYDRLKKEEERRKKEEEQKKIENQRKEEEQRRRDEEDKKRKEESAKNAKPNDAQLQPTPARLNPAPIPQYVSIGHYGIDNPDLINKINAAEDVSKKKRDEILANPNLSSEQKTKEIINVKVQTRIEIEKIRLIDLNNKLKTIESDNSINAVDRFKQTIPILRQIVHINKASNIQKVIEFEKHINSQSISESAKSEQIVKMLKDLINGKEPRLPQQEQKPVEQHEKPDLLPKDEKAKSEDDEIEKLKAEKKRLESAQNAVSEADKLKQEIEELKRNVEKEKLLREIAELKNKKVN